MMKEKLTRFQTTKTIIGVDEVGRGSLVGDVVACACILDYNKTLPENLNDSKLLSSNQRISISSSMEEIGHMFCIGSATCNEILEHNILGATMIAMSRAIDLALTNIANDTEFVILIDGPHVPSKFKAYCIPCIKGDSRFLEIAAASIFAKVHRDEYMNNIGILYPQYQWHRNKGYATKNHIMAIKKYGSSSEHRITFLNKILKSNELSEKT